MLVSRTANCWLPHQVPFCANTSLKSAAGCIYECMCVCSIRVHFDNASTHKIQCLDILITVDAIKMILICIQFRNPFPIYSREVRAQRSTSTIINLLRCERTVPKITQLSHVFFSRPYLIPIQCKFQCDQIFLINICVFDLIKK